MRKTVLTILGIAIIAIISFAVGYFAATWKLNCCTWGEPCERNIDAERCDSRLGYPQDKY